MSDTRIPFAPNSPTSQAAADQIRPSAATLRAAVYTYIQSQGHAGATDDEIQRSLNMPGNTERPRRQELEKDHRVVEAGRTRRTASGRAATVWVAAEFVAAPYAPR